MGFWRPRRGRKSGPEARVSGLRRGRKSRPRRGRKSRPRRGRKSRPEGPEIRAPGGAGPRGLPLFVSLPHSPPLFLPLFHLFLPFQGFKPTSKSDPLRGSQAFDLFARVGEEGASRSTVFGPGKGVPPLCCQKVMTYTRSCVGKSFEIRRVTVLEFGAGFEPPK